MAMPKPREMGQVWDRRGTCRCPAQQPPPLSNKTRAQSVRMDKERARPPGNWGLQQLDPPPPQSHQHKPLPPLLQSACTLLMRAVLLIAHSPACLLYFLLV